MPESFIPVKFLSNSELKLLNQTKYKIPLARSSKELSYYELILDVLMLSAFDKKREVSKTKKSVTNNANDLIQSK